ncbi:MAG TPA: DUF3108 domain-containing protein [Thermodesulfobacteriota bacterium]|nr:DUF3108 domain-containing protein [Thermodesulfobacteriota bacterium]
MKGGRAGGRRLRRAVAAAAALLGAALARPAAADERCGGHPALAVGERLVFEVSWLGIPAGRATLAIEGVTEVDGRLALRLASAADSNKLVDTVYKVRDRAESLVDCAGRHSLRFVLRTEEGRRRRERDYTFDPARQEIVLLRPGEVPLRLPAPGPVQDPLSSLYYVRTQPLEVGRSLYVATLQGTQVWQLEVQVLRREAVEVPAGRFDAIVVKPLLRGEGLFRHKGDVVVWLTDDARRMPVRMTTSVAIGSVAAELTSYESPAR